MNSLDISYMQRTRDYYRAQGYEKDYVWAQHTDSPFCKTTKALADSTIAVVTTSMPDASTNTMARKVISSQSYPPPDSMFTDNLSWDKQNTHTDDVASFLPLKQLQRLADSAVIGALATRFHSVPTEYSQRATLEEDAPEILQRLREDAVDAVVLVPL